MRALSTGDTVKVMDANPGWTGWYGMEDNGQDMWLTRGAVTCLAVGWAAA